MSLCASSVSYFNIVLLLFYSTAVCHIWICAIKFILGWLNMQMSAHSLHMHTRMHIYMHTHTCTHTGIAHAHTHTCMHAHMRVYMWARTHTCALMHACTHTHTHTHTHMHACMHTTVLKLTKRLEMFSWLLEVLCNSLFQPMVGFVQNVLCHCGISVGDCVAPCQPWLNCRHLSHNVMSASVSVIASTCQKSMSCQHHC